MRFYAAVIVIAAGFIAGCAGNGYRDNTSYTDGYLHTPIDNDIYN